ncbi:2-isopropylmalate synthase [Shewanella sp. OPT22]|nr:2-isopropylmalate synthase [Shewanella sp. OPT22]
MKCAEAITIFDTTLRDGEQMPDVTFSPNQKLELAIALQTLGIDVIEAGFAASSAEEFSAIELMAIQLKDTGICCLARALRQDIDIAAQAIRLAEHTRIHTFIATSDIHMQHKLKLEPQAVIDQAVSAVKHARNLCDEVQFSCEDASRSDFQFLCKIIEKAIDAGASIINIPDTVGYALPQEFGILVRGLIDSIPNADKATFSVHCHNDLGLATANSLAGIQSGARQVECTMNGLGERAGNAALEEIVMAIKTHSRQFPYATNIKTEHLVSCSKAVAAAANTQPQLNKAIVGKNAFRHESGIHQDGMLKHSQTYEIISPQSVGWAEHQLVMGKLSGRNALLNKMNKLNIILPSESDFDDYFHSVKRVAAEQQVCDNTLIRLSKKY